MRVRLVMAGLLGVFGLGGVAAWMLAQPRALTDAEFAAHYAVPLAVPDGPQATYHLGHSLVGRDMPALLSQLSGADYASQLGWGASLRNHWQGDVPGFAEENGHPRHRPVGEAVDSGDYPVVVLTEMVEIRDAIRYHDSAGALADWALRIRAARPDARIYLYETWHRLDDPEGWMDRVEADRSRYWEGEILRRAMAIEGVGTIHVIPGGQVMAAVARAAEAGSVQGLSRREDLFALGPDGTQDMIHFNDLGAYLMALTHYAVIYHQTPVGLPHDLSRADGTPLPPLSPETAQVLQRMVWQVVTGYPPTGVVPVRE